MLTLEQLAKIHDQNKNLLKVLSKYSHRPLSAIDLNQAIIKLFTDYLNTLQMAFNTTDRTVGSMPSCITTSTRNSYVCTGLPAGISLSFFERSDGRSSYFILENSNLINLRYHYQHFIGSVLKLLFHFTHHAPAKDRDSIHNRCQSILARNNLKTERHRFDPTYYTGEVKENSWQVAKHGQLDDVLRQVHEEIALETAFIQKLISLLIEETSSIVQSSFIDQNLLDKLCADVFTNNEQLLNDANKSIPPEIFFSQFSYITPAPLLIARDLDPDALIYAYQSWVIENIAMIERQLGALNTQAKSFTRQIEPGLPGYTRHTETNNDSNRAYNNNCWKLSDIIARLKLDFKNSLIPLPVHQLERIEKEYDTMLALDPNNPTSSYTRGYGKLVINNNRYAADYIDLDNLYPTLLAKQLELLNVLRLMITQQSQQTTQLTEECKQFAEAVVNTNLPEILESTRNVDDILNHIDMFTSGINGILNNDTISKLRALVMRRAVDTCSSQDCAALEHVFATIDTEAIKNYDKQFNKILTANTFEKLKMMVRNDFAGRIALNKVEQSLDPRLMQYYDTGISRILNAHTYEKLRSYMQQTYNKTYPKSDENHLSMQASAVIENSIKQYTIEQLRHFCQDFVGTAEDNNKDGGDKQKEFILKITPLMLAEAKENLRHTVTRETLSFRPNNPSENASLGDLQKRIQNLKRVSAQIDASLRNSVPDERLVQARAILQQGPRRRGNVKDNNEKQQPSELARVKLKPVSSRTNDIRLPTPSRENAVNAIVTAAACATASSTSPLSSLDTITGLNSRSDKSPSSTYLATSAAASAATTATQPFLSSPLHTSSNNHAKRRWPHQDSPPPPPPRSPERSRADLQKDQQHFKALNIDFERIFNFHNVTLAELHETLSLITLFHENYINTLEHDAYEPRGLEILKCYKVLALHYVYTNDKKILDDARHYVDAFMKKFSEFTAFIELFICAEDMESYIPKGNEIIGELRTHYLGFNEFIGHCLGTYALANIRTHFMEELESLLKSDLDLVVDNVLICSALLDLIKESTPEQLQQSSESHRYPSYR